MSAVKNYIADCSNNTQPIYAVSASYSSPLIMPDIPATQTVAEIVNAGPNARMAIRHDAPVAAPGSGEVLVKLECTGVW